MLNGSGILGFTLGVYAATDPQCVGPSGAQIKTLARVRIGGHPDLEPRTSRSAPTIMNTPVGYDKPNDDNKDGVYEITIDIVNRSLATGLPVTVTVLDTDEAPVITNVS